MNNIQLKTGEKIYEMDGGWENDDPDEYSIKANQTDHPEACAYYDKLRARKLGKKLIQSFLKYDNSKYDFYISYL